MRVKQTIGSSLLTLFFLFTAGGTSMATKFDWLATDSAPKKYPMEIVRGDLFFPKEGKLYVPNKKILHHGWGTSVSVHIVGDDTKPLPERLEITFFSYTENQFYKGDFELPYEKILKLFQNGYDSPKVNEHTTYKEVVVGVAPGGHVSVWLNGIDKTTEVFSGQAEKTEVDWKEIIDNPDIPRVEYIQGVLERRLKQDESQSLKKNGIPFGLWETYRKRYNWQPEFTGLKAPNRIKRVIYFNGEDEYINLPLDAEHANKPLPIPKEMHFNWEWPKGKPLVFKLYFNEPEIFDAFKQLGASGEPLQLEMRMLVNEEGKTLFSIWLKNRKDEIFLKNTTLKNYGIPKKKDY